MSKSLVVKFKLHLVLEKSLVAMTARPSLESATPLLCNKRLRLESTSLYFESEPLCLKYKSLEFM